uniref:RING-type domain-containing protein n=1 Tax=Malurus cyaneus samueli TaxID=2593467 RepID=A0A8C5UFL4_9PASS
MGILKQGWCLREQVLQIGNLLSSLLVGLEKYRSLTPRNQGFRRGEPDDSGQAQKRSRLLASSTGGASEPEPVDLEESAGEQFTDVTADSLESEDINLTGNDSGNVVVRYEQQRNQLLLDSCVLSSDDEDEATDNDVSVTDSASEEGDSSDKETESSEYIVQSGRIILSTLCGHIFCSQCLPVALQTASFCPTCRTELTAEQFHPIYI